MLKNKFTISTKKEKQKVVKFEQFAINKNIKATEDFYKYFQICGTTMTFTQGLKLIDGRLKGTDENSPKDKNRRLELLSAKKGCEAMIEAVSEYSKLGGSVYPKTIFDTLCLEFKSIPWEQNDTSSIMYVKEKWFPKVFEHAILYNIYSFLVAKMEDIMNTTQPYEMLFPVDKTDFDEFSKNNWGDTPQEFRNMKFYQVGRSKGQDIDRTNCSLVKMFDPLSLLAATKVPEFTYSEGELDENSDKIITSGALMQAIDKLLLKINKVFDLKDNNAFKSAKVAMEFKFAHSTRIAHVSNILKTKKAVLMGKKTRKGIDVDQIVYNKDEKLDEQAYQEMKKAELEFENISKSAIEKRRERNRNSRSGNTSTPSKQTPVTNTTTNKNNTPNRKVVKFNN